MPRKSRFVKGSQEAKDFMKSVRDKKKGMGMFGDLAKSGLKFVKNEALNKLPAPQFLKEPISNIADKGIDLVVSKTGLGIKKPRKKIEKLAEDVDLKYLEKLYGPYTKEQKELAKKLVKKNIDELIKKKTGGALNLP